MLLPVASTAVIWLVKDTVQITHLFPFQVSLEFILIIKLSEVELLFISTTPTPS